MFKPKLREYAAKALTERGVEVLTGERVASVAPTRVTLKSGEVLKAHTLVWGAGLQGNPLVESLGLELQRGNRVGVDPDLTLAEHPEVFVVGDVAAITDAKTSRSCPSSARSRCSPASTPARRSPAASRARRPKPFHYNDKGTMATIGRGAAVVQMLGGRTMTGKAAWLAWGAVHLALLPTTRIARRRSSTGPGRASRTSASAHHGGGRAVASRLDCGRSRARRSSRRRRSTTSCSCR